MNAADAPSRGRYSVGLDNHALLTRLFLNVGGIRENAQKTPRKLTFSALIFGLPENSCCEGVRQRHSLGKGLFVCWRASA